MNLSRLLQVHVGKKSVPAEIAAELVEHFGDEALSDREVEVLRHVAGGNRNRDIAERLFIAEETVKAHLTHIMTKLRINDRTEAVAIAASRGIIQLKADAERAMTNSPRLKMLPSPPDYALTPRCIHPCTGWHVTGKNDSNHAFVDRNRVPDIDGRIQRALLLTDGVAFTGEGKLGSKGNGPRIQKANAALSGIWSTRTSAGSLPFFQYVRGGVL